MFCLAFIGQNVLTFYMLGFLTLYVNLSHGKLNIMFSILFIFVLGKINENLKKCIVVRPI